MFKQRGAMSPMRRERPPQAAQQDTLLSCPGGLRVVPCPQQMTRHLLLAPRAPLGLATALATHPQGAPVSPLVQQCLSSVQRVP